MAAVSFYLIQQQIGQLELACRICRKSAMTGRQSLLVKFDQQDVLQQFDDLLWQFDPSSFIPHDIDDPSSPICLSLQIPDNFSGICLNLGEGIVDPKRFEHVLEIVENDEPARAHSRMRFRAYREQGIEPVVHQV
ncbi:DNA polymerase III subunit chi [Alkanindiges sp. WGS2144]|uniref:DNA polymerase III subunit chi n=1 Tax=Alkanindiges sp. WGS2144 TaxID=3366808 RepID=UPI00375332DF